MDAELRPPKLDETARVADLLNRHSQQLWGEDSLTPAMVEHWFSIPGLDPEHDMRVAVDAGGELVGYADVNSGGATRTRFWIDLRLLPDAGEAVGRALLETLEARARKLAAPGALARGIFAERDELARHVFESGGYRLVRHSLRMERGFEEEPEEPEWPEGFALRTATEADPPRVWAAVEDGFADHWEFEPQPYDEWLHAATGPDTDYSLWFLAEQGDEIAGSCLCRPHEAGDRDAGYVASLSVRPRWRRRGLALALLLHAFRELRRRGRARVTLGVDAENTTGAVRLYERAGMHIARQYDLVDKPLD